jgi:leucyl aminopeptidase
VYAVRPADVPRLLGELPPPQAAFLRDCGFTAKAGVVALLPGPGGVCGAALGLGTQQGPNPFGALPFALPEASVAHFAGALESAADAALGFCLGAYCFNQLKLSPGRAPARLLLPPGAEAVPALARITWLVRDLINLPANLLGPVELAEAARVALAHAGADVVLTQGMELTEQYPLLDAVGRGSSRPARVVTATWRGPNATDSAPLVSLCGKGVCFDTGGYDLKPASGMLRMKKDLAGAAIALGVALLVIENQLDVRLELRLGCVENSISGHAMRPLDVIRSRAGLSVAIGNTDAEGRLVLADLLSAACDSHPDLLLDFATLTGAARVALGPDIVAMFSNDDSVAAGFEQAARVAHDPLWRMPLWSGYDEWLDGNGADLNNVSDKPYAGAVIAALFLQRFVRPGTAWSHLDVYGWNDATRPGRPEGGEAMGMRAAFGLISRLIHTHEGSP